MNIFVINAQFTPMQTTNDGGHDRLMTAEALSDAVHPSVESNQSA